VKLPRDLSGHELAKLLRLHGYELARQVGSHLRLTSSIRGSQHHVTIPAHKILTVGTLGGILAELAAYLKMSRAELEKSLFDK
jgi:predicted RNA binding protein YcfA (HicA-like mRNA interferase family)